MVHLPAKCEAEKHLTWRKIMGKVTFAKIFDISFTYH